MKLASVALACVAAALLSTSAKAANATDTNGDLILGIYDGSGNVTNSYEVDLGKTVGQLTNGETFNLGADINTSVFPNQSTVGYQLVYDIEASGGNGSSGVGGLFPGEIAVAVQDGSGFIPSATYTAAINDYNGLISSLASNTALTDGGSSVPISNSNSLINLDGNDGLGLSNNATIDTPYLTGSGGVSDLYAAKAGGSAAVELGTFSFNTSTGILTFNSLVPEPSTYALVIGGLALLWVLRRRSSLI